MYVCELHHTWVLMSPLAGAQVHTDVHQVSRKVWECPLFVPNLWIGGVAPIILQVRYMWEDGDGRDGEEDMDLPYQVVNLQIF